MTIAQRKQREREKRRQEILDSAEGLFFSKGYDNVTMDDIAERAELNKATIYLYYENKEALFYSTVIRGLKTLQEMVDAEVSTKESGIERMWSVWQTHLNFAWKRSDYFLAYMYFHSGRFDLNNMVSVDSAGQGVMPGFDNSVVINIPNGQYVKCILDLHNGIFETLCNAIREAIKDGDIRSDVNPPELAALILLLAESSARMNPLIKNELGQCSISQEKFLKDIHLFLKTK